jgi:hypothetical protein
MISTGDVRAKENVAIYVFVEVKTFLCSLAYILPLARTKLSYTPLSFNTFFDSKVGKENAQLLFLLELASLFGDCRLIKYGIG